MLALKEYLIEEFKDRAKGYVACEFKYSHSTKIKSDKASGVSLKINVVKIGLKFVDKDMNTLLNNTITFENNVIPKNKEKSFINISPKELNNKFAFAKSEIIKTITGEYNEKLEELNAKINEIKTYTGNDSDIIKPCIKAKLALPLEVKGETVKIDDSNKRISKFDM